MQGSNFETNLYSLESSPQTKLSGDRDQNPTICTCVQLSGHHASSYTMHIWLMVATSVSRWLSPDHDMLTHFSPHKHIALGRGRDRILLSRGLYTFTLMCCNWK